MTVTEDIIGQAAVIDRLRRVAAAGRPNHAYLFSGPPQVGKTTTARWFAASLLCAAADDICGQCRDCTLQAAGNHPDYRELPEDDALTIADIRDLKQLLTIKPHSARFRICLIPNAERLGIPAQNALLKLLEEPPPRTVLILTAAGAAALLPTTVSRCEQVSFTLPSAAELRQALPTDPRAEQAIQAAGGRPGLAIDLLEQPERLAEQQAWERWLLDIVGADSSGRLAAAKQLSERDEVAAVLDCWLGVYRLALLARAGADSSGTQAESAAAGGATAGPAQKLAGLQTPAQLLAATRALFAARQRLSYNPNTLLLLERTLLNLDA